MKRDRKPFHLPPYGIYIGSGIYPMSKDYLLSTLHGHQSWMPQSYSVTEMLDKVIEDNQGNLAQLWPAARGYAPATIAHWQYALDEIGVEIPEPDWSEQRNMSAKDTPELGQYAHRDGAGLLRFIREAAKRDIYTMLLYTDAKEEYSSKLTEESKYYIGYDFGERFTFHLDEVSLQGKKLDEITLKVFADDLIARVREHVDERRAAGWGLVYATSSNFYIDYEIVAGTDVPLVEDFAFSYLNIASALSRGLYRQFNLPTWGSHLAHEHYSWIPNATEHKWHLFKAAMYMKYMSGCKIIINESGNWFVEASLCEDSPKFEFPRVPLTTEEVKWNNGSPELFIPYIEEARKSFHKVDYNAPIPRRYRKEISDFYDFIKENGTPEGQPESTVAIAKGNYDIGGLGFNPNSVIAGAYTLADENPRWFSGAPERGWKIVKDIFYPTPNVIAPYKNSFLSGTPFGQVDIVSFVQDEISAEFLNANYKALLFSGWNTSSDKQYSILKEYVHNGGILFISIPQLSTNVTRNFTSYTVDELVNGGDFSELCGLKVLGRGDRIYWATAPDNNNELGFSFPRRFGVLTTPLGKIEITDPSVEVLVVDDEQAEPVLLRHKYGKGTVYFLNSWAYPGALDQDYGPGSRLDEPNLIGHIYRYIANHARGTVWLTDDGNQPASECEYINYSYFPEAGKIYLYNIDPVNAHSAFLHISGKSQRVELGAGEFKIIPFE